MKSKAVAITTIDNPYDPIDDFIKWFTYDESHGYGTSGYLARLVNYEAALNDDELSIQIEAAIDEMIQYDFECIYKKVVKEVEEELITASA